MKIVTFWGGLGNQIFEYAYYKWLQEKYPNETIYGYYPSAGLSNHNGLEINTHFNVTLPSDSLFSNFIGFILFNTNRVLRRLNLSEIATCTQLNGKYRYVFHCDYWQDKSYITKSFDLQFSSTVLSKRNKDILKKIRLKEYIAVHIRRGDFLKPSNISMFGGICNEEYYNKAISYLLKIAPNAKLLFFSDDSDYVNKTYNYPNMTIVDWNKGEDSIFDMYLMSECTYLVLANSTFSYWAARLNRRAKIICCPPRWTNKNSPNIILDTWRIIDTNI